MGGVGGARNRNPGAARPALRQMTQDVWKGKKKTTLQSSNERDIS